MTPNNAFEDGGSACGKRQLADMPYKKPFELGFFMYSGNTRVGDMFHPYLWGDRGAEEFIAKRLKASYGHGLRFILVEFYVFGGIDAIETFPQRKVSRFAEKQMAIRSNIPVLPAAFHDHASEQRAVFVGEAVKFSVSGVAKRLEKRFPEFDFGALEDDTAQLVSEYVCKWK